MGTNKRALVVDDEADICELLEITLGRMGVDSFAANSLQQARELLRRDAFDLCLTDMRLPDGSGIELVKEIEASHPGLPVAVITAHGNMETAVEALKAGAFDFVSKPVDLQGLRRLVESALRLDGEEAASEPGEAGPLLGDSGPMREIRAMISKLSRSQAPVYISGQSGTGKELAARQIHAQGPRSGREFVAINCGAIPQELMESEFFGHKKGSFTGATADKQGLFEAADGGTLFLDEVADLPLHMQVKLLRAIQEKVIRPVGSQKEQPVDVRIISATHKDLAKLVEEGAFRQDLFYRINVIELTMPPLRERSGDIRLLAGRILARLGLDDDEPLRIDDEAMACLERHPFPGNVRELENTLERAATLCDGNVITAADLALPGSAEVVEAAIELESYEELPFDKQIEMVERKILLKALEAEKWNRTAAAKRLGMTFRSLRYRLGKLKIE
jgi:two-component system response regulator PilR (NtrC family)